MKTYLVLLRGINVGGKNKVSMAELKVCLEKIGYTKVVTYINSGNVVVGSSKSAHAIQAEIQEILPKTFKLDSELIKILVLSHDQLRAIVDHKPKGFGDQPKKYYSDVIFLMDIEIDEAWAVFDPREGVDKVWPGEGVVYSQRLGSLRTKSRLSKIVGTPVYKSMTIRTWGTVTKLLAILDEIKVNVEV